MENWANRKTLVLSRSEMVGLLTPREYLECVEQAYRMHGEGRYYMDPKGHIVLDRFAGEWEDHAFLHRGAARGGLQMGVDPREQPEELQPADGVLDPDLH